MPDANGYNHAEAFKLMKYASDGDGGTDPLVERIWNSRDGVTPFVVSNHPDTRKRFGLVEMRHVDWGQDRIEPFWPHVGLRVGDRIFVDMTKERARELAEASLQRILETEPDFIPEEDREGWLADAAESNLQHPDLIVVTEEVLARLQRNFPRPYMRTTLGSGRFA